MANVASIQTGSHDCRVPPKSKRRTNIEEPKNTTLTNETQHRILKGTVYTRVENYKFMTNVLHLLRNRKVC